MLNWWTNEEKETFLKHVGGARAHVARHFQGSMEWEHPNESRSASGERKKSEKKEVVIEL